METSFLTLGTIPISHVNRLMVFKGCEREIGFGLIGLSEQTNEVPYLEDKVLGISSILYVSVEELTA